MLAQRLRIVVTLTCLALGTLFAAQSHPTLAADPVLVGAGDIADCSLASAANSGAEQTAKLLDNISGSVVALGDNAYPDGAADQFSNCYDPTWGRHKARTRPVPGNHDYNTSNAAPYYSYFGASAGTAGQGYYSYDLGAWHIIALNSEIDAGTTSAQAQWLRGDLAGSSAACTLAYWHKPLYSSGQHGNLPDTQELWKILHQYGADVVLSGHDHDYERFAAQDAYGAYDPNGIREFVVGTGGADQRSFSVIRPNSEKRDSSTFGVLKLTLHAASYDWQFVPVAGGTFTDLGTGACFGGSNPTATATNTATPLPQGQKISTFTPDADAYADQATPSTAYATNSQLLGVGGTTAAKQSFLRFTVSGLPTGSTITSAKLQLYVINGSAKSGGIFNTTTNTSWVEKDLTWNNRPAVNGPQIASVGPVTAGAFVTIDVLPFVSGNGAYGFAISSPADNTDTFGYTSREGSILDNRPQLIITTQTGPLPTATPTSTPTDTPTVTPTSTTTNTPTVTPTSTATNTPNAAATATPSNTPSATPSWTATSTPNAAATATPTNIMVSTSTPTSTPTATPLVIGAPIKTITFESGSLINATTGVDSTSGTLTLQASAPLKDSYSVAVPDTTSYGYLIQNFSVVDEVFVSFYFKAASFPASARIAMFQNSGTTVGNLVLNPVGTTGTLGALQLKNGTTSIGSASPTLSANTLYRIGLHQRKGSGSNGLLEAYLAVGDSDFGTPFVSNAVQTFTTQANKFQFGATNSNRIDATFDDIKLDSKAMPGPSGSAGSPTATTGPASTPTNTPTSTPISTPTNTPTRTPTSTPTSTPGSTTGNLLANGGFELDANGDSRPDSWTSDSRFTRSTSVVRSGTYSGRHGATNNANYTISQQINNLQAGKTYSFSSAVNIPSTNDNFTFKLDIQWRNSSNSTLRTDTLKSYTKSTGGAWDPVSIPLSAAPTGTTSAQVRMVVSSLNATVYVDDVVFQATTP